MVRKEPSLAYGERCSATGFKNPGRGVGSVRIGAGGIVLATIEEQIKSLEDEIGKTKYNKATQGHIGKLKAKIAALRARKGRLRHMPRPAEEGLVSRSRNQATRRSHWLASRASASRV